MDVRHETHCAACIPPFNPTASTGNGRRQFVQFRIKFPKSSMGTGATVLSLKVESGRKGNAQTNSSIAVQSSSIRYPPFEKNASAGTYAGNSPFLYCPLMAITG